MRGPSILSGSRQGHTNLPDFTKVNWPNLLFVLTFFGAYPTFF